MGAVLGTGAAGPLTGEARANFRRDLAFQLLTGVFLGVVLNFFPVVARRLGAGEFLLALLTAGTYLGALLSLGAPYVLRTLQPARRIALIWAVGRALWIAALFVTAPTWFAIIALGYFLLSGLPRPGVTWLMQGAYPAPLRGRLLAAARMAMAVAALITAPIAGLLLDVVGHGPILAGASVVGMLAMAAFAGIKSSDPRPFRRRNPWVLARGALATPSFRGFVGAWNTMGFGIAVMMPAVPIVLVDHLHASFGTVGVLSLLAGVAQAVCLPLWGRLIDRRTGPFGAALAICVQIASPVMFLVAMTTTQVGVLAAAYLAMGVAGAGFVLGSQTTLMSLARPEDTPPLATTFNASAGLFGVAGPFVGGLLLIAGGPNVALSVAAALTFAGAVLMLRVARSFRPADALA